MISSLAKISHKSCVDGEYPANGIQYLNWRIAYGCNYECPMCTYWRSNPPHEVNEFPQSRIAMVVQKAANFGLRYVRLNGGEPTMHTNFIDFIRILKEFDIVAEVASNGSPHLDDWINWIESGLSRINFSIDSFDEDEADLLRGVRGAYSHLFQVLDGIKESRCDPYLSINCVLTAQTFKKGFMEDFVRHYSPYGIRRISFSLLDIDSRVRGKPNQSPVDSGCGLLTKRQLDLFIAESRVLELNGMKLDGVDVTLNPFFPEGLEAKLVPHMESIRRGCLGAHIYPYVNCIQPWIGVNVIENGDCFPCLNTTYTPRYLIGNIIADSMEEIFNGPGMRAFRAKNDSSCNASCIVCKDHQQRNFYWPAEAL